MRTAERRLGRLVRSTRARRPEPFDSNGMHLVSVGLSGGRGPRLLRGLLQRDAVAAVSRRHRPARVPPPVVGRLRAGQPPLRARRPPRRRRPARPSGCTITSSSWCRGWCASCAATSASASSITSRSPATRSSPSCPGAGRSSRACSARTCSAFSARATPPTSCGRAAGRPACTTTRGPLVRDRRAHRRSPAGPGGGLPDLDRLGGPGRDRPARGRPGPGPEIRRALGQPEVAAARHRPAGLHQGHPAPPQGLRRAAQRGPPRAAGRGAGPGGQPEPGAGRGIPAAARRGRGHRRPDQRRPRARSAARPCTTCTSPTRGRRWPRCTWPPT